MSKKSTNIEIWKRIEIVSEMIIKGYSKSQIVRYGSENWKIGERQIEDYIKRAHELFVIEAYADNLDKHLQLTINKMRDLYQKSYAIQDYAECRRIVKDLTEILGFGAAKKIDHTTKGEAINIPPISWVQSDSDK